MSGEEEWQGLVAKYEDVSQVLKGSRTEAGSHGEATVGSAELRSLPLLINESLFSWGWKTPTWISLAMFLYIWVSKKLRLVLAPLHIYIYQVHEHPKT